MVIVTTCLRAFWDERLRVRGSRCVFPLDAHPLLRSFNVFCRLSFAAVLYLPFFCPPMLPSTLPAHYTRRPPNAYAAFRRGSVGFYRTVRCLFRYRAATIFAAVYCQHALRIV